MAGEPDVAEAERWYAMAADAGSPLAEHGLARIHLTSGDFEKALAPLRRVASKEYPPALCLIGRLYLWGRGVERKPEWAVQLCDRVMRLGNSAEPLALISMGDAIRACGILRAKGSSAEQSGPAWGT